jgi:16S rRNA (adenine1518-N6/adenine1519-N6)-dimethyltransferase
MLNPRQTRSFLMKRFEEAGINPKTRYGQNFLIDLNLVELLAVSAELSRDELALEVGGGTGSLTGLLAERAGHVVTVEVDPHMAQMSRQTLAGFDNITLLLQDVLRNKNNLATNVLETVSSKMAEHGLKRFKLTANLPYNIATPLMSNLLLAEPLVHSMTVTIQKELADRIMAEPSTKDYSALSVWIQSQCDVELIRVMPPTVFWPRPKVDSAIIKITVNPEKRERIENLVAFHAFSRAMFFHRRKFLRSALVSAYKNQLNKEDVDKLMEIAGLAGDARAEQLKPDEMIGLCSLFTTAAA